MSQNLSSAAVVIGILSIIFVLKMSSAYSICCIYSNALQYTFTMVVNIINPDQTAPQEQSDQDSYC